MDCTTCKEKQQNATVSRYAFETMVASYDSIVKRLWIVIIILIMVIAGFIIYESQFTDEVWTYEATTDGGGDAIANGDGNVRIIYGDGESDASETNP